MSGGRAALAAATRPAAFAEGYGAPREVAFHLYIRQAMRLPYNAITGVECQKIL